MLIVVVALTIGGVEALASKDKLYTYELGIINNSTNVVSTMRVRAKNEKEARDNVVANGWAVFSIRQLTYDIVEPTVVIINEGAGNRRNETAGMIDQMHSLDALSERSEKGTESIQDIQSPTGTILTPSEVSYIQGVININQTSAQAKRAPTIYKTDNKVIVHNPASTNINLESINLEVVGKVGVDSDGQKKVYHDYALPSLDNDVVAVKSRANVDFNKSANESKKVIKGDRIYLDGQEVSLKVILYFHFGADEPILDKVITSNLGELPKDKEYIVVGYTDGSPVAVGNRYSSNYSLSYARAESVAKLLPLVGIKDEMITLKGGGVYSQAVTENGDKVVTNQRADSQKRRVEVYVK